MQNTPSRLEAQLERMLTTTHPPAARTAPTPARIDLAFLAENDQRHPDQRIRQP